MPAKKKTTRRVRGPDGKLHTKEELKKLTSSSDDSEESSELKLETNAAVKRDDKPSVQEKATKDEKETSPVIILSWNNGKRRETITFTCDTCHLEQFKKQDLSGQTPKTVLDINISATVIEQE